MNVEGKYSLDAVQNNPSVSGSLRQEIKNVKEQIEKLLEWKFLGVYEVTTTISEIDIPASTHEIWFVVGVKSDMQVYGGKSSVLPHNLSDYNIVYFETLANALGNPVATGFFGHYNVNTLRVKLATADTAMQIRIYYR